MNRLRTITLCLVVGALIASCASRFPQDTNAAARTKLINLLDSPPADSAVLVIYSKDKSSPYKGDYSGHFLLRNTTLPLIDHDGYIGKAHSYHQISGYYVPPGEYVLRPHSLSHDKPPIRTRLEAGETLALNIELKTYQATELAREQLLADPFLDDLESASFVTFLNLGHHASQRAAARMLNGEKMIVEADGNCLVAPVRVLWPNARFSASVDECHMQRATIRYDSGVSVDMPLADRKLIGISWSQENRGQPYVERVFPGSPAESAGLKGMYVVAVDGQPLPAGDKSYVQASRLIKEANGPVILNVAEANGVNQREVRLEPAAFPATRLSVQPSGPLSVTFPDGRRFDGQVELSSAREQGQALPPPKLGQVGQWTDSRGGYLGGVAGNQPNGPGYCYQGDGRNGQPCRYEQGKRVESDTGVSSRSRQAIMAETQGLTGQAAIDLLKRKMIDALSAERWTPFLRYHDDLQTLGVDTGLEAIYYQAKALSELGRVPAAFERVQAYLNLAGTSGAAYSDALALYSALEPRVALARTQQQREREQAREDRRAFCAVQLEQGEPLCGCREFKGLVPAALECGL